MYNKLPPIKTAREYRAVKCLARRGRVSRKDLDDICGALNSPEVIRGLRALGWDILCERFEMRDRDGKVCRPGIYYVMDDVRPLMYAAYKKWDAVTSHSSSQLATEL